MDDKMQAKRDGIGGLFFVGALCISIALGYLEGRPTGFLVFGSACLLRAAAKYLFNRKRFERHRDINREPGDN